jgi:hypothetical protein
MKIFEKAKQIERREEFAESRLRKKLLHSYNYNEEDVNEMCEYILGDECVRDIERLESGDYYFDYPQYRLIPKNFQDKKRAIYLFKGKQGLLMKYLVFSMRGIERVYSDRLFSFRSDRTASDLLREITQCEDIGKMYVLKTDVSNYVGSIVPELVIPMLEEVFLPEDPEFFHFLEWLLTRNKVIDVNGNVIDHCPGGLGGIPIGNFLMNLYLHEMDEYYAPRAAFYSRYSDDILICARTYDEISLYEKKFYEFLDRLRLHTNKEKTMILMPGEPFDLLGMEICGENIRISDHAMSKIKRKLRKYSHKALVKKNRGYMTTDEAAADLILRFNRLFFGLRGGDGNLTWAKWAFPVINDTDCLKEIDHYLQNSLRYVIYGSMKQRNKSVPYEKLGELGYKSLMYYYHHPDKIRDLITE